MDLRDKDGSIAKAQFLFIQYVNQKAQDFFNNNKSWPDMIFVHPDIVSMFNLEENTIKGMRILPARVLDRTTAVLADSSRFPLSDGPQFF